MDSSTVFQQGRSLLNEALSPSSKRLLQEFFEAAETDVQASTVLEALVESNARETAESAPGSRSSMGSLRDTGRDRADSTRSDTRGRSQSTSSAVRKMVATSVFAQNSRTFVQIQCDKRPFGLELDVNGRQEIIVTSLVRGSNGKGAVERSGLIEPGDILVAVNDDMDGLTSVEATEAVLARAQLPAVLTFRRVAVVKPALGEYTRKQIARHLQIHENSIVEKYGADDAAAMIKACIDVLDDRKSITPLMTYVGRVEQFLCPSFATPAVKRQTDLVTWMDRIHAYVERKHKDQVKKWNAMKSSNFKRIEILGKQRESIRTKLESMRSSPEMLHPDNREVWQEFIELRHLSSQMSKSIEQAKQEHFLPDFEHYALRFGSEGVYIGLGDLWISSFRAKFTVETRSNAPHIFFHLSTPSSSGLQLRITNFKLSTEGRLPSFQCDELNIEAQLVADVPFVFDAISGWSVPADDLHVKLESLRYFERKATSVKHGVDHDTVMKLFINRLLPIVVRQAAQNLFAVEIGPLLETRDAQIVVTGEINIQGRPLDLYDAPLNTSKTGGSDHELSEEARLLVGLSEDEGDAICKVLKSVETGFKKRGHVTNEHGNLSIRVLTHYFDQFRAFPHLKTLLLVLWQQSIELLLSSPSESESFPSTSSFAMISSNLAQLQQYPVDISVSLSDLTFRLDLCEAAAVYYTTLQRLIRNKMDSVSVGLSNMEAMKDGTYLQNQLTSLDSWYNKITRVLSYVTINVDDLGVVFRGGFPAGVQSPVLFEAQDLACKGPCTGSFTIPLTDLAKLQAPRPSEAPQSSAKTDSLTALLHENNALIFSKFFLRSSEDDASDDSDQDGFLRRLFASDRVSVSVQNTSARVLFEVPTGDTALSPGETYVPFAFTLATGSDDQPTLRIETGEHAKCQYKAEQIRVNGTIGELLGPLLSSSSVWSEYADSPFFSLRFHFFVSCQVTREHIFWSLRSASLSQPKVAQIRHRFSLGEFLQDLGMVSLVDNAGDAADKNARRREDARFRRALHRKLGTNGQVAAYTTLSARETLFSATTEDMEQRSEAFTTSEMDSDAGQAASTFF
ncbi:hypothetical protein Poli38472_003813 [Pythium oligandrum]|uniref:PDZ domain-containing protein n=1 Tax=Pythium oligandrum TaxID=41045 RepID=A0A8K1CNB1_PYTOL|nr:hypothetical protein Poli38472_003813 [Pythium oligandrum]|eukprot:TMW66048.1 hypothetical protein Poli38472_003813 [Pythium oligandrum]